MSVDIKFTQKGHLIKQDKLGKGQNLAGACPTLEGRSIVLRPSQPAPGHTVRLRHQEGEFKSQMMHKITNHLVLQVICFGAPDENNPVSTSVGFHLQVGESSEEQAV